MGALQLEGWPDEGSLTLSGVPRDLRLPVTVSNSSTRAIAIKELSLADLRRDGEGESLRETPVPVGLVVGANAALGVNLRLRLERATPPGRYTGQIDLAGMSRSVEIEVAADFGLGIRPDPIVIDAGLGTTQTIVAAVENRGNVTLILDVAGRYPLGEELPLGARAARGAEGAEEIKRILDLIPGLARRPALVDVGAVELTMPDGAVELRPGETASLVAELRLPETLSASARYQAFIPLYAADLHIVVVTAAKQAAPAEPPASTKGTKK